MRFASGDDVTKAWGIIKYLERLTSQWQPTPPKFMVVIPREGAKYEVHESFDTPLRDSESAYVKKAIEHYLKGNGTLGQGSTRTGESVKI